jgi:hypothetical protein
MRLYNNLKKYEGTVTKKNKGVLVVYEGNNTSLIPTQVATVSVVNADNTASTVTLFAEPATDGSGNPYSLTTDTTSYVFFPFSVSSITNNASAGDRISIYELF